MRRMAICRDGLYHYLRALARGLPRMPLRAHLRHAGRGRTVFVEEKEKPVRILKLAALLSAGVALLHVAIVFWGAPGYLYFDAGEEMVAMAQGGSIVPGFVTALLAIVFAVWAAYALSGAGAIGRLPLLRTGLVTIGTIYTVRGLLVIPQLVWGISGHPGPLEVKDVVFSVVPLVIGLLYLLGARSVWTQLDASQLD